MRIAAFLLLLAAFFAADRAQASPTISIHWSDCTSTTTNRSLADGATATVVVTAHGLSGPVVATQTFVNVQHRGYWGLPEAWRFDDAGCQAGRFQATATMGGNDCGFLAEPTFTFSQFRSGETGGGAEFSMVFDPVNCDPAATYTIAKFTFDFSNSSCPCADQGQCLNVSGIWYDQNFEEHFFFAEREYVTWEDPLATTCGGPPLCGNPADCVDPPNPCSGPTPTHATSWGSVKASYR